MKYFWRFLYIMAGISIVFSLATDFGADALSNFRITTDTVVDNGFNVETVKITGFAIKRLAD